MAKIGPWHYRYGHMSIICVRTCARTCAPHARMRAHARTHTHTHTHTHTVYTNIQSAAYFQSHQSCSQGFIIHIMYAESQNVTFVRFFHWVWEGRNVLLSLEEIKSINHGTFLMLSSVLVRMASRPLCSHLWPVCVPVCMAFCMTEWLGKPCIGHHYWLSTTSHRYQVVDIHTVLHAPLKLQTTARYQYQFLE